jgi:tetratricopeptide (TPR) repeat protein
MTDRNHVTTRAHTAALRRARRAFDLVQSDPGAADAGLAEIVAAPVSSVGAHARVVALWGLGRLAHDRGAFESALTVYTDAVGLAADTGLSELAAEVRVSWAVCLQASGATDAGLAQLDLAEAHLTGATLGRLHMQRGFLLAVVGERTSAVEAYDRALPLLLDASDDLAATRTISNRGIILLQMGQTARARADFVRSKEMAERLGQHVLAAGSLHNLAYLEGRLGRFPQALGGFAEARRHYAEVGSPGRYVGDLDIDECEVLIEVGLAHEAASVAARVVDSARGTGNSVQLANALVFLARSQLMHGDPGAAEASANEAAARFDQARRTAWVAFAQYLAILAADGQPTRRTTAVRQFVRLRDVADRLERFGWISEAAEIRVLTGRHAIAAGRPEIAAEVLGAAASARRHPLARIRAEAWYATALLAASLGDRSRAWRALETGLRAVDAHRSTFGASELRARAGRLGQPLSTLGLRLAIDSGNPSSALRWAERGRAASIGAAPDAARNDDGAVGAAFDAIRRTRLELAELAGAADDHRATVLTAQLAELEADVTRRVRQRQGGRTFGDRFDHASLRRSLGNRTIVEFVEIDGDVHAIVVRDRTTRLVAVGPIAPIDAANEHVRFALRRLSMIPSQSGTERAASALERAAAEVDAAIFANVRRHLGEGPVIVVPTGSLHSVLWSALPTAARAGGIAIAPSAAWWQRTPTSPPRRRSALLVAGPGLRHAEAEIDALHRIHPRARVLRGRAATVDAVKAAMSAATLVHVAAHGMFRADNPMFSTLTFHDGVLSVHELEGVPRLPDTVVLSACSSGRSGVLPGDELLGTSAALMALGVRSVAAPLLPIADHAAAAVSVAMHTGLRRGHDLPASLGAFMRRARRNGDHEALAAGASFVVYSAGPPRISA